MQLIELLHSAGNIRQLRSDVVLDVEPSWGQQIHLDDSIAVAVSLAQEAGAFAVWVIASRAAWFTAACRVMCI